MMRHRPGTEDGRADRERSRSPGADRGRQSDREGRRPADRADADHGTDLGPAERDRPPARGLQGRLGNRAVQRLVESGAIQPKLRVGRVDSPAEREADRMAERVLRLPDPLGPGGCVGCGGRAGEPSPDGSAGTTVRRSGMDAGRDGGSATVPPAIESRVAALWGAGRPLPEGVRSYFEPRFGEDLGDVTVHTGPRADEVTRSVGAEAMTVGRSVFFSRGRFETGTREGRRLVAHELAHVVQNRDGAGRGTGVARRSSGGWGWWECAKGAAVGAGTGVWGLIKAIGGSIWSPIDSISNAYNGVKELVNTILDLNLTGAAKQAFPKLYTLATEWSTLAAYRRCKLIGEVLTEYGAGLLSGAGAAKIVKKLKSLRRAKRRSGSGGSTTELDSKGGSSAGGSDSSGRMSTPASSSTPDGRNQSVPTRTSRPDGQQRSSIPDRDGGGGKRDGGDRDGGGRDGGDGDRDGPMRGGAYSLATTPWGRRVYQRTDIDWEYKPDGKRTNRERAADGYAPVNRDGNVMVLHHMNLESGGALAEVWSGTHTRRHVADNALRRRHRREAREDLRKRHPDLDLDDPADREKFERLVDEEVQRRRYQWRQDPEMSDRETDFRGEQAVYWKWRVGAWSKGSTADPSWPGGE